MYPGALPTHDLHTLQRTLGNRRVQQLLTQPHVQAKGSRAAKAEAKALAERKTQFAALLTEAATDPGKWVEAAVLLNQFDTSDILDLLRPLTPEQRDALMKAAPVWAARVQEPLKKLQERTGALEEKQFKQIKAASLKEEAVWVKAQTRAILAAVKQQDLVQAAILLNSLSDKEARAILKKLQKSQRVAIYYTAPDSTTRIKAFIGQMDKIGKAAIVADKDFERVKQLYPDGITVAIYANYKVGVRGAAEFKRAGEEFATNQHAIALHGDKVVIDGATPINDLGSVAIAVQRIHQGLLEKHHQSQPTGSKPTPAPKFTRIRNLALFAHGEPYGVGLDRANRFELKIENVKTFVSSIRAALTDDVNVQLFACSTAADRALLKSKGKKSASYIEWTGHTQGERTGLDSFAAALADELGEKSTVVGHTTVGHTTENFAARIFGKGSGGQSGLHMFDLMYKEAFIQAELVRLFPDKTDDERAALHDSLREQMWAHFKDSISGEHNRKARQRRYARPMGQEMFINPTNAEALLHADWQTHWIPTRLKRVKPAKVKAK